MFSAGLRPLVSLRATGMRIDSLHEACSLNLKGQLLGHLAWDHLLLAQPPAGYQAVALRASVFSTLV